MEETGEMDARQREEELKELNARLDILEAKVEKATAGKKSELRRQIEELKKKRDILREKLDRYKTAGEGAWQDIKAGVEKAARELRNALEVASKRFQ